MIRFYSALALIPASVLAAEDVLPTGFPADRYAVITQNSPFALATAQPPPPPPLKDSFAANWFLTAVARNEEGRDFITVKAQDGSVHFSLTSGEPGENGVSLASVDWSDEFRKSTATIKKGSETAKLIFSQEAAAPAPLPNPGGGRRPGAPGAPPLPVIVNPVTAGGAQIPTPQDGGGARSVAVPRPGMAPGVSAAVPPVVSGQVPAANGVPAPASDAAGSRRRIRTIAAP